MTDNDIAIGDYDTQEAKREQQAKDLVNHGISAMEDDFEAIATFDDLLDAFVDSDEFRDVILKAARYSSPVREHLLVCAHRLLNRK